MKLIVVDTREKQKAIKSILATFDRFGIEHISSKLPFGDYMDWNRPNVVIDRKQNIAELVKSCTTEQDRFLREIELAKKAGSTLVILVEQDRFKYRDRWISVNELPDIILWESKFTSVKGERVFRILTAWINRYNLQVKFCNKRCTGKEILKILYPERGFK